MTIKVLSWRGTTKSEIARLLGVTEGAVRYHVARLASGAQSGRSRQVLKTHLCANRGIRAVEQGFSVQYFRFDELITSLKADADLPPARLSSESLPAIVGMRIPERSVSRTIVAIIPRRARGYSRQVRRRPQKGHVNGGAQPPFGYDVNNRKLVVNAGGASRSR